MPLFVKITVVEFMQFCFLFHYCQVNTKDTKMLTKAVCNIKLFSLYTCMCDDNIRMCFMLWHSIVKVDNR